MRLRTTDIPDFELPSQREATEPPEARGLSRDEVRLMVSRPEVAHHHFYDLPDLLAPGDILAINTSATLNAALKTRNGLRLHLSTELPGGLRLVELRLPSNRPFDGGRPGEVIELPASACVTLHRRRPGSRLWEAELKLPSSLEEYLSRYGAPISYPYVRGVWPSRYYQTAYATEPGSSEMPSAGRAFTPELITRLVARGVQFAPLILHTGVSSLEADEPPYEEYYRVPEQTARLLSSARREGRRIVAVGTTVVRALETATTADGLTHPAQGWTELVINSGEPLRSVSSLLTGLHEPRSSHLALLESFMDRGRLFAAYTEAINKGYLWHEFGDLHLILGPPPPARP